MMPSLDLLRVLSGLCGMIVIVAWVRPHTFLVLIDLPSNHPSLAAQGQFTAMVVSTWALVQLTLDNELTEWFFGAYMLAFAGAKFGSAFLKLKGGTLADPRDSKGKS